jgi:REP element-mobilizing transposase RayT
MTADTRAGFKPAPTISALSEIVRALKTFSARKINKLRNSSGNKFWQRDYFEHIIRNENSHLYIIQYITNNPVYWKNDKFYTE